ncbi:MAG: B12-binding domain-containing radical SAM protein [Promethearchaeia archaeon]
MTKTIVLTTDETNFLNPKMGFFIPGFIPSLPRAKIPNLVRFFLEKYMFYEIPHNEGEVYRCIYGLRKIEAILEEAGFQCKVISPQVIEDYADEAALFGVYSMDPLGVGPVTATLQGVFGDPRYNMLGDEKYYEAPYTHLKFKELIEKLKRFNKPIIVGGSGASQFDMIPQAQEDLGIDHLIIGDVEKEAANIFNKLLNGEALPKVIHCKHLPEEINIPTIKKPVSWGLIEISRGCDRHCKFCDPQMKRFRWIPKSKIIEEAKINLQANSEINLMSEDVFRYGTEPHQWTPDWGLVELVRELKNLPGLESIGLSHACLSSALAAPEQIEALSAELHLSKENYLAVQPGVETGAIHLIKEFMPYKAAPFDPEQWHEVVIDGWKLLAENHIYPAATLMIGLEDSEEDIQQTISMMKKVTKYPGIFWPLYFSSLGNLREKHRFFVDWNEMKPGHQELFLLAIEYMMKQHEKMHPHLFGSSPIGKAINHFVSIVGRTIVERAESDEYIKGKKDLKAFYKLFIKNLVQHSRERLSYGLQGYNSKFYGKVEP